MNVYLKSKAFIPGPQHYGPHAATLNTRGTGFSSGRGSPDWLVHNSVLVPGPGKYQPYNGSKPNQVRPNIPGGRWSHGVREFKLSGKNTAPADERNPTPGPGEYILPDPAEERRGGRISASDRRGFLHDVERKGRQIPGPARYSAEGDARITHPGGGRFNTGRSVIDFHHCSRFLPFVVNRKHHTQPPRTKSGLEWEIYYSKGKPGRSENVTYSVY